MTHAFRFITIILATFKTILIIIHSLQLLQLFCLYIFLNDRVFTHDSMKTLQINFALVICKLLHT